MISPLFALKQFSTLVTLLLIKISVGCFFYIFFLNDGTADWLYSTIHIITTVDQAQVVCMFVYLLFFSQVDDDTVCDERTEVKEWILFLFCVFRQVVCLCTQAHVCDQCVMSSHSLSFFFPVFCLPFSWKRTRKLST